MNCTRIKVGEGYAIVCRGRERDKRCHYCGSICTKLCDHVMAKTLGGSDITCDQNLCDMHAHRSHESKDIHYCPKHEPEHRRKKA